MKRQKLIGNMTFEVIKEDDMGRTWKITQNDTKQYAIITVSNVAEISFEMHAKKFEYSKALDGLVQLEKRTLSMNVDKKREEYKRVIERTKSFIKVPCSGVSFQIYYLKP